MEKFSWIYLSEEELVENFSAVRDQILADLKIENLINAKSSNEILEAIKDLKKFKAYSSKDMYFISEKHKKAFLLLKHQRAIFDEELEITNLHYLDHPTAKKWRDKNLKEFHPDRNIEDDSIDYKKVSQKINKIFSQMTGKA